MRDTPSLKQAVRELEHTFLCDVVRGEGASCGEWLEYVDGHISEEALRAFAREALRSVSRRVWQEQPREGIVDSLGRQFELPGFELEPKLSYFHGEHDNQNVRKVASAEANYMHAEGDLEVFDFNLEIQFKRREKKVARNAELLRRAKGDRTAHLSTLLVRVDDDDDAAD